MRLPRRRRFAAAVIAIATAGLGCAVPPPVLDPDPGPGEALLALHATRGLDAALVDSAGRQVTLRGANFNQLGDYFVTDPRLPMVATLDAADWDDAQALGFNVVRLVTTWSAWEPIRGTYDGAYLGRVKQAVEDANAHGMYVLLDLHQDAWSRFVFAPVDHTCPAGWSRTRGWDGAPAWATFTDDAETCSPDGRRESSPAVLRAWTSFYENRAGIRDAFAALWGHIAWEFAGHRGVAGFDLLNEPGPGFDVEGSTVGLAAAYRSAISAIRAAERRASPDAPSHPVFFEPLNGAWPIVSFDFSDDPNLVFAPHTYAESLNDDAGTLEPSMGGLRLASFVYGTPVFMDEYGAYRDAVFNTRWTTRVHGLADQLGYAGDAWWQWEQACGDPHNTFFPMPEDEVVRRLPTCGNARSPQACPTRPYPRAAPGRIDSIQSPACGEGAIEVRGRTSRPGTADLWFPSAGAPPVVSGEGIEAVTVAEVPGGYRAFVRVAGTYRMLLIPPSRAAR